MAQEGSDGIFRVGSLLLSKAGIMNASGSGAPTDGSSGTLAGKIAVGGDYTDRSTGYTWTNIGTKAAPKYVVLAAVARVAITSTNILNMFTTPVLILAAPGANRAYSIQGVQFAMTTTATQYAAGGAVSFVLHGGSTAVHSGSIPASVVTAAAGTDVRQLGQQVGANGQDLGTVAAANVGVDITNATQAFTTGTGTAVVVIEFAILPTN